ncbi:MAG: ParB/RepB/Spo0J family partition protein [Rhodobacteraceae bacterium]|nr:ParB/RepB/Spo0J family partition protein [Paracoccaceae bacterium]
MELQHIELNDLKTTALNVRKKGAKDIADLVPSIRSLGLLQPLLVRQNCEGFEIIAGQRRFYALQKLSEEQNIEPVPCIIMAKGDDAKAIEASLAENIARLPMDEIDQYKAFASLVKQGQSAEEIATLFGITERLVTQRLAIANLIAPILTDYRKEKIHPSTIRILTMATKRQQKDWLKLFNSDDDRAPEGYQLKAWLFGGANIPTENALFDLADYSGGIVADLFGEEQYFDDIAKFWEVQNTAIAKAKDAYLAQGWQDVIVLDVGDYFPSYEYVDTAKEDGGKVYVHTSNDGEVTFYEGQLPRKESKAKLNVDNGEATTAPKPELTKAMQNYLDLHRHSAVRTELLNHSGIALRLGVAQMIAGSELWTVHADAQKANSDAIGGSLADNKAEESFAEQRKTVQELLGIDGNAEDTLVCKKSDWHRSNDLHAIFAKLINLNDEEVITIQTFVIAETLPSGSAIVEVLGDMLNVDMAQSWKPDQTFFNLLRDKPAINAMLKQVAGKVTADAHISSTAKVQKQIIQDCLNGTRKGKKQDWQPNYMAFPMADYTKRGGIGAMTGWNAVKTNYS